MKNPILDVLKLQEENSNKQKILEAQQKTAEELNSKAKRMSDYEFYSGIYGNMNSGFTEETRIRQNIKKNLLTEGIYRIFSKCVRTPLYENTDFLKRHLSSTFVNESNVNKLLDEFSSKSYLLSELTRNVLEYTDVLYEKAKDCKDSNYVDPDTKEDFYKSIDAIDDMEYVQDSIKARVAAAINRFNIDNTQRKRDIENQLLSTREKINSDMTENLKEHTILKNKQKENMIRNHKKSIFEAMVNNVTNSCYKNEELKSIFFTENNSPDYDKIIDHTKIMYGFLEMLNTTGMKSLTGGYIKEQVNNLKVTS